MSEHTNAAAPSLNGGDGYGFSDWSEEPPSPNGNNNMEALARIFHGLRRQQNSANGGVRT